MEANSIMKLVAKKIFSILSEDEQLELKEWIASSDGNRRFYNQFTSRANVFKIVNERRKLNTRASWKRFEKDYLQPAGMAEKKSLVVKYVTVAVTAIKNYLK